MECSSHPDVFPSVVTLGVVIEGGLSKFEAFERLVWNVMAVDNLAWTEANGMVYQIRAVNLQGMFVATLQAKIGIVTGVVSGIGSIPLVSSVKLSRWFNREFVTTDARVWETTSSSYVLVRRGVRHPLQ